MIRSGDQAPNSNDDELVTDALMGRSKTGGSSGHASSQGAAGNIRAFDGDNGTSDLKNELQTGYALLQEPDVTLAHFVVPRGAAETDIAARLLSNFR